MDLATLFGLISGLALVSIAIAMGGDFRLFFDLPSIFIVFGGTLAAICVAFLFEVVIQAFYAGLKAFGSRKVKSKEVVNVMVKVAEISRSPRNRAETWMQSLLATLLCKTTLLQLRRHRARY